MTKFESFYKEIQETCRVYDAAEKVGPEMRPGEMIATGPIEAFNQNMKDTASRVMAAVVTEELSTNEARTLLLYIQIMDG